MKRCAGVYLRKAQWLIHAQSQTVDGISKSVEPFVAVPLESDDESLGQAIRARWIRAAASAQSSGPC